MLLKNPWPLSLTFSILAFSTLQIPIAQAIELSPEAIHALREAAASGEYEVRIVEKTTDEGTKSIVLLGERHVKNKIESDLGKNVVSHFNLIGLEGTRLFSPEGEEALKKLYSVYAFWESWKPWNFGNGDLSYPSTGSEVVAQAKQQRLNRSEVETIVAAIIEQYDVNPNAVKKEFGGLRIGRVPDKAVREYFISLGYKTSSIIYPEDMDEFIRRLRTKLYKNKLEPVGLESFDPSPPGSKEVDATTIAYAKVLEDSAKSFWTLLAISASTYITRSMTSSYYSDPTPGKLLSNGMYVLSTLGLPYSFYLWSSKDEEGERALEATREPRNQVMAKRMDLTLSNRPKAKTLLAIFGLRHMPGIVEALESNYGYEEVPY